MSKHKICLNLSSEIIGIIENSYKDISEIKKEYIGFRHIESKSQFYEELLGRGLTNIGKFDYTTGRL